MSMAANFVRISQQQLDQLKADPSAVEAFADELFEGDVGDGVCDVDKSWQTIHYLLTGQAWGGQSPAAQAIMGGTEIGPDLGYGPVRCLDADQVKRVATALNEISAEELANRFDAEAMESQGIYAFSAEDADEELEMAKDYFNQLKDFYQETANREQAMLLLIV